MQDTLEEKLGTIGSESGIVEVLYILVTCKIKSWIAMEKAAFNKKRVFFTSKIDL
jgi:hypothetical protein